jgi:Protein of unknown function (DUF1571)
MRQLRRAVLGRGARRPAASSKRFLLYGGLIGLGVLLLAAAQAPSPTQFGTPPENPMDLPLRLIADARQSYQGVRDYACMFVKRERIRNVLQPENVIVFKARTRPFSVYLRWVKPAQLVGQEACYVEGRNNGMLRALSPGLLGSVGFVSIDPRDPRCFENSRHAISEAGIGHLIDVFSQRWELENRLNRTQVQVAEYIYNQRRCLRVDTRHPDNSSKQYLFYRSVVYFDKENHLPIRVENYDLQSATEPNGSLVESYSYPQLRLNVNLPEATFAH